MAEWKPAVGTPLSRVDGRLKVTGGARYAAEFQLQQVAYGVLVTGSIARGKITKLDTAAAERVPGVLKIITHRNAGKLNFPDDAKALVDPEIGDPLMPFQNDLVHYHGQPIALVVAETLESATHAATLVRATYLESPAVLQFADAAANSIVPEEMKSDRGTEPQVDYQRGEPNAALAAAEVKVEATYTQPDENHNPMELHATLAAWEGGKLTLHDKTQWVDNVQQQVAAAFNLNTDNVRVVSPFVGGAFGSALRAWLHVYSSALAAREIGRPVKLVLTRAQQYVVPGYRPQTVQKISLGATKEGKLTAIVHEATSKTSAYEQYTETIVNPSRYLYACPNVITRYRLAPMNYNTPASMRGPGVATGVFALECALDELAYKLNIDPLELRLRNHADENPEKGLPWSSKSLKECYSQAAEKFGWANRTPVPRSMRDADSLIGWGMASATWPTHRKAATVQVRILADGTAHVRTATSDIGPGTYTVMTQIAADALGMPVEQVHFDLGDTDMPQAPVEGGSMTVASVGPAVHEAALAAQSKVLKLASDRPDSPLHEAEPNSVAVADGRLFLKSEPNRSETYADIIKRSKLDWVEAIQKSEPGKEQEEYAMHAFGAQFVEVRVDPDFGTIRIGRVVSGFAAGRIINPKTARSQAIGGIVMGLGMALLEEVVHDRRNGRVVNANLEQYMVPTNADVPHLDVFYVEEQDKHVNALGAKGLAELSLVGVASAVANAVYHATGKRVRDLPIVPERLL